MVKVLKNKISSEEIQTLIDYYNLDNNRDQRPDQNSKQCPVNSADWPNRGLTQSLLIRGLGYNPEVERAFYLEKNSESHYHIHVDTYYDDPVEDIDKKYNMLVPLEVDGYCTTVFFKNYYSGSMAKFTQKNIGRFSYYLKDATGNNSFVYDLRELYTKLRSNSLIYGGVRWPVTKEFVEQVAELSKIRSGKDNIPSIRDYTKIKNFNDQPVDKDIYNRYLSGMNYQDFHGLTLDKVVEWELGDIILFPKTQLHTVGTTHDHKLHYTVFTR